MSPALNKNKKIIIIAGYLASGKSTFAIKLSKSINVPYFVKDTFKQAICAGIEISNREDGRLFSAVTFDAITYVAERFMETGYPLIIEGNFVLGGYKKANEADVLKALIDKYGYRPLTFIFTGELKTLCDRFNKREQLSERGQANKIFSVLSYEDFIKSVPSLGDFTVGGEIVRLDTTDFGAVDFESHVETARSFMNQ